ncbi:MAG TPA: DnaJ domain-containing protein [Nitrospiria bacterium]
MPGKTNGEEDEQKALALKRRLRDRIADLQLSVERCGVDALEKVYQERMDTYFAHQERLEEIEVVLCQLMGELESCTDWVTLKSLAGRLTFLEDHYDQIDSTLFNRPVRRRPGRFSLFEFLNQWGKSRASGTREEVANETDAYRELGVEPGTDIGQVTATFRKRVKELHPDRNGGDRSSEPRFRKLVAAYTFLKKRFRRKTA